MHPATAVAESKCLLVQLDDVSGQGEEFLHLGRALRQRARHEQEDAQAERRGDVGHHARDAGVRGQRRAQVRERDAGGDRHERAVAEQRTRLGEHAGDVLRAHRDDHDVGRLDEIRQ